MKIQLHGGPFDQEWIEVEGDHQFCALPVADDSLTVIDKPYPDTSKMKKAIYHYTKDGYVFDRIST